MTSPSDPDVIHPARGGAVRVAFYGRVACCDDPRTAIPRQPQVLSAALPGDAGIVEYFADVGPWKDLRGSIHVTDTWHLDGYPVEGGLIEQARRAPAAANRGAGGP